jgi:hypothetical protein
MALVAIYLALAWGYANVCGYLLALPPKKVISA